ncbi:MAG: BamA/TamA family outer membrane protein [Bacteroidales bacterium]|nr:BamA/TamA family outer membrane protein [Bacteroidales bacterium]
MLIVLLNACNSTRYVPKDEYLLNSSHISIDNRDVSKEQLSPYIRQKPNKKILGFIRFHLWLYNKSDLEKDNKWNNWLRKNGEEPVIWQQSMTNRSREQLSLSLKNRGYYYVRVTDTVKLKKKKADVFYNIHTGWAYTVEKIKYSIPDSSIARLILADTIHTLLRRGMPFDSDILAKERKRIETHLKDNGYYSFGEEFISYSADTLNRKVVLELNVRNHTEQTEDNRLIETPYPQYRIRRLTVNANLSMQNLSERTSNPPDATADTLTQKTADFIIPRQFPVKSSTIAQSLYISPDSLYRISHVNQTYQHLVDLRNFQQVSFEFSEPFRQNDSLIRDLDCQIHLLPFEKQSFTIEPEITNSDGNLGGGINLSYQNRSLFYHAEIFDLKLKGMIEAVSTTQSALRFKTAMEYEAEVSLNIPKFLLSMQPERFIRRYNPKTVFSVLYNYQRRPYYTRSVFSTSMGYNWRGSEIISHVVRPVDINYVQLKNVDSKYAAYLEKYPYLKNSYQTHMVVSSNYTFTRDLQQVKKDDFLFIRTSFETAGLLLNTFVKMSAGDKQKPYQFLDNTYSQFIKGDVDLRYYYTVNANNRIVTRLFAGIGLPYGNSRTGSDDGQFMASMPFEKKYFAGGTKSMRGWRLRSLGPGSFVDSVSIAAYPNNTGDIKLETNIEYRFKLVWVMEGALFLDAGNVWDTRRDDTRVGANFDFKRFYREIALNTGFGLRFDFTYFIFSADLGMKLFDPANNRGWIFRSKPERGRIRDFNISIGFGYPF